MYIRIFEVKIPESVDLKGYVLSMIIATKLYKDAKLSAGQAAEMVGLSKKAFAKMLGKNSVSVFSTSVADLHDDI